ncbi:MAG: glycosyltransferase family 2 protein [Nanoarchaeota archaeon]
MKTSIIVPVYNEEKTIKEILIKVLASPIEKDIIVVDDCSTDKSYKILKKYANENIITLLKHEKNQGKGAAIRTGLQAVNSEIVLIQDADLEYDPEEYPRLIEPILEEKAEVVYGTRLHKNARIEMHKLHYVGNKFLTLVINLLYGAKVSDMETGYKVIKSDIIKNMNLKARKFDFEPEITAKLLKKGHKIYEIPINFNPRSFKEGKKITWRDGLQHLYYIIKYRFVD